MRRVTLGNSKLVCLPSFFHTLKLRSSFSFGAGGVALTSIFAILLTLLFPIASAAAGFAQGNVVVYRAGDGGAALSAVSAPVFLDEYTPSGSLVQSIALPTALNGINKRLTASGSATTEGFLTLSADGKYLVLSGYDAATGATVTTSASSSVNRVVGRVDAAGNIDTSTGLPSAFSAGNPRGIASDAGGNFWLVGSNTGVVFTTLGSSSSTIVSTTQTNLRQVNIYGGQLYISTAAGTAFRLATVGSGLPTTAGQTATTLPGFPTTGSTNGFFFAHLNPAGSGLDTLYVADDTANQLQKWSLVGANWVANGSVSVASARGLTGTAQGTTVTLFVSGTALSKFVDSTGYNISISGGAATTIATAGSNKAFRGVALTPVNSAPPPPTNPTGVGAANPSSLQAGNSSLLTVTVSPGTNPVSTGLAVTADLTSIGGSSAQAFSANGNTFSFQATVSSATTAGNKTIPATITDAQSRTGSASILLTVTPTSTSPTGIGSAAPASGQAGSATLLTVNVTSGSNPTSTGLNVVGDLHLIGGSTSQQFFNDGTHGDAIAGDSIFSFQTLVASAISAGAKSLPITVSDAQSRSTTSAISFTVQPPPPPTTVKLSQVYGGGGNSGSTYTNDFMEIYNQATTPVDLTGWSVQYNSATAGTTWQVTNICASAPCILQPGHYFLVQESQGAGGTTALPPPDASGIITMSGTAAKVALVASISPLSGSCPTDISIVDLVGYGGANCFEGAATAGLSNTTASVRRGNGCVDTDNNANDFLTVGPIPRNSSSPANSCGGDPSQPSGLGLATPNSLEPASDTLLTVKVTPASAPSSAISSVTADLSSIGGVTSQTFYDDGTHGDQTAGDNVFSFQATVGAFISTGVKNVVSTITDAAGHMVSAPITLTISSPTCGVERWSVKTGTDPDAGLVNLNTAVRSTIFDLGSIPAPGDPPGPPLNARVAPTETTVYVVNANMTLYKKETDVDYHIVLDDGAGHTMVSEIPSPACVGPTSPFAAAVASARAKFNGRFSATSGFQTANIPVQVKGVGFFDFIHGQTGVAPDGIELHPILEINFTANTSTTLMSSANPSQYGQPVTLTATVSNGGQSTPTGNVTFFEGASTAGIGVLNQSGQATFTSTTLPAGPHSFTASYEGDSTSAPSTSALFSQVVNKADQSITFGTLAGKTFGDADFAVSASASSSLAVSFSVSGPASITGNTVHITGAGTVTIRASQSGDSNYNAAPDVDQSFEVSKASQTITFAALPEKTYGDAAFAVSASGGASGNAVTFVASGNCSASGSSITISGAGSCTVTASQPGNSNYDAAGDVTRSFNIKQATAIVAVNGYSGVYDGHAHGAAGTATGVNSEDLTSLLNLGASFTDVPGGTAHWSFAGNANYLPAIGDAAISITPATATVNVNGYSGVYDGHAHGATGSVAGVNNEDLTMLLNLGASFTNVPGGTAHWTFSGNINYSPASGDASIAISQATATVNVNGYSGVYDGHAHGATGSATGVNGEDLTGLLNLGASFTDTPGGTAHWSFTGNTDYSPTNGDATISITRAGASINVAGFTGIYDGHAHGATGSATGVNGEDLTALLNLGASFTDAPGGTAHWSFAGNTDYSPASGDATITISRAAATVNVSGYSGVYDGHAHGATGSASGVNGEDLTALLNLGASFTDAPGGTAHWSFAGNTDYSAASGSVNIGINKASPLFSNLSSPTITYGTATTILSGQIKLGTLIPTGNVAITLNGVTQNALIQAGGNFSSSFATAALTPNDPAYTIGYTYGGDVDFNGATGSGSLTVSFGMTPQYDPTKAAKSGSTIPIKFQLSNAAGANVSSASITVTAIQLVLTSTNASGVVIDSGNANPDNNFRFTGGIGPNEGYIFNLSTKGLATGNYNLIYRVQGDPVLHALPFQVR